MNFIKALLSQSDASGSKSTILKPLTGLIAVFGIIFLSALKIGAAAWVYCIITIMISLTFILFLFAYVFCLLKDRDALRSEKFSIRKMEIERGIYGDNNFNFIGNPDNKFNESSSLISSNDEKNI